MDVGTTSTAGTDCKSFGGGGAAADLNRHYSMIAAMEPSLFRPQGNYKIGIYIDCYQGQFLPQNRVT